MGEEYGTKAENIVAAIGPSIGQCCFQVDMPVIKEFRAAFDFADEYIIKDEKSEKGINSTPSPKDEGNS